MLVSNAETPEEFKKDLIEFLKNRRKKVENNVVNDKNKRSFFIRKKVLFIFDLLIEEVEDFYLPKSKENITITNS